MTELCSVSSSKIYAITYIYKKNSYTYIDKFKTLSFSMEKN